MGNNDERMSGAELQTVREYLGLTLDALAGMLNVREDTLRRWESGRERVPHRVREEVEEIEAYTAAAVGELVEALNNLADPGVIVYRNDEQMHAARPDTAHLPARWWRHVVARAAHEVPGLVIASASDVLGARRGEPGLTGQWHIGPGVPPVGVEVSG